MTLKDETIFSLIVAELLDVEGRLENLKFYTEESRTLFSTLDCSWSYFFLSLVLVINRTCGKGRGCFDSSDSAIVEKLL